MRKIVAIALVAHAMLLAVRVWQEAGAMENRTAAARGPAFDERHCADSDGDGQVTIADAISILSFLFTGSAMPHCIAQEASPLEDLEARVDMALAELASRVESLDARTRPPFEVRIYEWRMGSPPIRMIHSSEGICYLSGTGGNFQGGGEFGVVEVQPDGYWYLRGGSLQQSMFVQATSVKLVE